MTLHNIWVSLCLWNFVLIELEALQTRVNPNASQTWQVIGSAQPSQNIFGYLDKHQSCQFSADAYRPPSLWAVKSLLKALRSAKVIGTKFGLDFKILKKKLSIWDAPVWNLISGAWIVAISEHFLTHVLALCGQDMERCRDDKPLNLRKNHACMNFLFLRDTKHCLFSAKIQIQSRKPL